MRNIELLEQYFKTLSVPIRLKIINMLSCGELCACELLEGLSISQSTLSHHMKVLTESGLVLSRKKATWMYYSINKEDVERLHQLIDRVTTPHDDCICYSYKGRKKQK